MRPAHAKGFPELNHSSLCKKKISIADNGFVFLLKQKTIRREIKITIRFTKELKKKEMEQRLGDYVIFHLSL